MRKAIRNCRNIFGYKKSGKIVDLGCGNGRNLLFLLKNGFDVVGIDNSKEAIKIIRNKIENIITNNNFLLLENGIQEDNFFENSDYLLSYSLHFLGSKQREFLLKLKNKTSLGNFNIIEVFLNEGKLSGNDKNLNIGELKEIYGNWKIYFYDEKYVSTMEGNRKDKNKIARIIAQKI